LSPTRTDCRHLSTSLDPKLEEAPPLSSPLPLRSLHCRLGDYIPMSQFPPHAPSPSSPLSLPCLRRRLGDHNCRCRSGPSSITRPITLSPVLSLPLRHPNLRLYRHNISNNSITVLHWAHDGRSRSSESGRRFPKCLKLIISE
ncbi:unnamed protein product, partial [Linum tenue]